MTTPTTSKPLFRVHFHDGSTLDVRAGNSLIAEKDARKRNPGAFVKKIKLVRDPSLFLTDDTSTTSTKDAVHG